MITSIRLLREIRIDKDKYGRFKVNGESIRAKDVPFVRYKLDNYTKESILYIKNLKKEFEKSVHLIELDTNQLRSIDEDIKEEMFNMGSPVIVYSDIHNEDLNELEKYVQDLKLLLNGIQSKNLIKLQLYDKTDKLEIHHVKSINKSFNNLNVGVCNSPLSNDGRQCLDAQLGRNLQSIYTDCKQIPLVVLTHQENKFNCYCIRYLNLFDDIIIDDVKIKEKEDNIKKDRSKKIEVIKSGKKEEANNKEKPKSKEKKESKHKYTMTKIDL